MAGFIHKRRRIVRGRIRYPHGVLFAEPQTRIRPIPQLAGLIVHATPTNANTNLAFLEPVQFLTCKQSSKMPGTAPDFLT
jgi:hypothetical protein